MDLEFDDSEKLLDHRIVELCSWMRRDFLRYWTKRSDGIRSVSRYRLGCHLLGELPLS